MQKLRKKHYEKQKSLEKSYNFLKLFYYKK